MEERIAFDIRSAAIWYSLGVTFMSVHHFLEHHYLRLTGLHHWFILVLSHELQGVWWPRWIADLMMPLVISIWNDLLFFFLLERLPVCLTFKRLLLNVYCMLLVFNNSVVHPHITFVSIGGQNKQHLFVSLTIYDICNEDAGCFLGKWIQFLSIISIILYVIPELLRNSSFFEGLEGAALSKYKFYWS
jgi:hypothetical protein